jgi:hypothetical protein
VDEVEVVGEGVVYLSYSNATLPIHHIDLTLTHRQFIYFSHSFISPYSIVRLRSLPTTVHRALISISKFLFIAIQGMIRGCPAIPYRASKHVSMLALKDNQILVENDLVSFPVSLRDDESMFLVSDCPVQTSLIPLAISTAIETHSCLA